MIIISLFLAFLFPFELFLFSYAFLGPLHYLTELEWLDSKSYFFNKKILYIFILVSAIISIIFLYTYFTNNYILSNDFYGIILAMIFLLIFILMEFPNKSKKLFIAIFTSLLIIFLVYKYSNGFMIIGLLLPTLVHVYLFTGLFMLYGYLKAPNIYSLLPIIFLFFVPFIIYFIPIDLHQSISEKYFSLYRSTSFMQLNNKFEIFLTTIFKNNNSVGLREYVLKFQIFMAFAYTYHYLNWFSKTSIIGWTKTFTPKKTFFIVFIWTISSLLFLYNYSLGLYVIFFLSLLHVLAEFPLNIQTIKYISNKLILTLK